MSYDAAAKITTDEVSVRLDLVSTLKLMYNSHLRGKVGVEGNNQAFPPSLQALAALDPKTPVNPTQADGLFVNVLDGTKFGVNYGDSTKFVAVDPATNIYWNAGPAAGTADNVAIKYTLLTSTTDITAGNIESSDINAYALMVGQFPQLAGALRELKIAYQLLDDDVFQNLTNSTESDGSLSLLPNIGYYRIYDIVMKVAPGNEQWQAKVVNDTADYTSDEKNSDKGAFSATNSLISFIRTIDPASQDIFVMRRLILCTYLAANFHFFFNVFYHKKLVSDASASFAGKIALYYYNKLQRLNVMYETSRINPTSNNVNDTVQDVMTENVKKYTENTSRLSYLSTDISNKKRYLTNEVARINAERASSDYASKLRIITISFSIIFAVAMLVVMMMPFDFKQRMKIAGVIAVLVVVLAIVMSLIVRRVDPTGGEGFVSSVSTPIGALDAVKADTVEDFKKLTALLMMEEMRNFYRYTIDIAMTLQNNRLYTELNYNSGKERNYFENSQYQLNKSVSDARNAQRLFDRRTKISTAVIRLFLQLLVIIAFVLLGVMAVQDTMPGMRPFIFTIGAILAVLAIIIFFAEILGRTRIDADKMYWGTPHAVNRL